MGERNNVYHVYMSKPERIRSVLEYFLQEKLPENWQCVDVDGFYTVQNSKGKISFRERDGLKRITTSRESFLLGMEHQEKINLIFPCRVMQMDNLAYERQIEEIQHKNRKNRTNYTSEDDYMYQYQISDHLEPIVTLTLYWGKKRWQYPKSLKDMLGSAALKGRLGRAFQDYKVNLIQMRFIPNEELEKMDSDVKYVVGLLKCGSSRKRYEEYIMTHQEYFRHIPKSAADVLAVCLKIHDIKKYLVYQEGKEEEEMNMCKAIEDMKKDAIRKGKREGKKEGRQEGMARVNELNQFLCRDGRFEDLQRSTMDRVFQGKLFREYNI